MRGNFKRFQSVSKAWKEFFLRPSPLWKDFWVQIRLPEYNDEEEDGVCWLNKPEHEPVVRSIRQLHLLLQDGFLYQEKRSLEPWPVLTAVLVKCNLRALMITDETSYAYTYSGKSLFSSGLLQAVGKQTALECLSLHGVSGEAWGVRRSFKALEHLVGLRELYLSAVTRTCPILPGNMAALSGLRRLALCGDMGSEDGHGRLRSALQPLGFGAFTNLKALESPLAGALVASMAGMTELTTLVLTHEHGHDVDVEDMAYLKLPASLVELRLGCPSIPPALAICTALRRLELSLAVSTPEEINAALRKMPRLQQLRLNHQDWPYVDDFLPALGSLPNLRVLNDASWNPPKPTLDEFWAHTLQLRVLALRWLHQIPAGLAKATSLEVLVMSSTAREYVLEQAMVLARLPCLRHIVLGLRCPEPLFDSSLEKLLETVAPHINIHIIHGWWPEGALEELYVGPSAGYEL